jgi:hypothetical protein
VRSQGFCSTSSPISRFSFRTLDDRVDATLNQDYLLATLSAFFGPLALLLAGLDLYGVTAYAVAAGAPRSAFGWPSSALLQPA